MKLSDFVADFIASLGIKHVFSVSGGGCMYLTDSVGKHERLTYVATHHEQAAAMAADGYARINGLGCCLVTTGPGGTNALTGLACAWVDSIPVIFISGQVTRDTLMQGTGLRQFGVQESDIAALAAANVKTVVRVVDPQRIRFELERAAHVAQSGRPGPVWLDIPLDVQSADIDLDTLVSYYHDFEALPTDVDLQALVNDCVAMLRTAKRPVLIAGNGVRLAGAGAELLALVEELAIPVVTSWLAADMVADNPHHIGHCGIFGDRGSNFAVQNADLLLVIGCRMSVPMIGYNFPAFAREAKIVMVDVDLAEIQKPSLRVDLGIQCDAGRFMTELLIALQQPPHISHMGWTLHCCGWRNNYPVVLPEYADQKDSINSFYFIKLLSEKLPDDAVVVLDMATAFTCTYQAAEMKLGQRWTTAAGHAAMGYGLPGAIGAAFATGKKVVCIVGDGGLQMNVQELATIRHYNLPITIFVLNNGGYLTIKLMQDNHFGRRVGSDPASGVDCPDTLKIAEAYKIGRVRLHNHEELIDALDDGLDRYAGPLIIEIMMSDSQHLIPRSSTIKHADGTVSSRPLEDMMPLLPREELVANMLVKLWEGK